MSIELRPCPFCGGNHITWARDDDGGWKIYCKQCRGSMWSGSYEGARELWNARAEPATLTWGDGPPNAVGLWRTMLIVEPYTKGAMPINDCDIERIREGAKWWTCYLWAGPYPEPQEPGETQ